MTSKTLHAIAGLALVATFALSGCIPLAEQQMMQATAEAVTVSQPTPTEVLDAMATVATRSLRVRELPTVNSVQVGSILNGEVYRVTGRSSDGQWFELEIPKVRPGTGWVSTDLVSVSGAIIDLPIFDVSTLPTPVPTQPPSVILPTPTPSIILAETVAEPTAEPVADAPAEPLPEATAAPLALPTATPAPEATIAATVEATPTVVVEVPAPGMAAVSADVRLRVRAEPNVDAPIVGYGYRGEVFPVLDSSADGTWTHIGGSAGARENPDGGWVATEFLLLGQ